MKIKRTLPFTISFILLIGSISYAQIDSLAQHTKTYGLRVGVDIAKLAITTNNSNFKGVELVADYRIKPNLFIASEFGIVDKTIQESNYNYQTKGSYIQTGINYNLYKNWLDMDNEIFIGSRLGTGFYEHTLNQYTINQEGTYFENVTVNSNQNFNNLNAFWLGVNAGIKTEIIKNLYLGIMVSLHQMIHKTKLTDFETTYVPGFGKLSANGVGSNINYTISYRIPIYKK